MLLVIADDEAVRPQTREHSAIYGRPSRAAAVRIAERAAGTEAGAEGLTIRVDPGPFAAGDYRLEIELAEPTTGQTARSVAPFVVR